MKWMSWWIHRSVTRRPLLCLAAGWPAVRFKQPRRRTAATQPKGSPIMKKLMSTLLAVVALVSTSIASAQDTAKQTITGTVVTAGQNELTIDTASGRQTFRLDSMLDRARYNDLKPGTQVTVTHKMDDQGLQHVVTGIDVVADAGAAPPSNYNNTTTDTRYNNTTSTRDDVAATLPQTASSFWSVALLALAALFAGFSMRSLARRHHV